MIWKTNPAGIILDCGVSLNHSQMYPDHRLEVDCAHRAPWAEGNPRGIIVKPHFYGIKEQVMQKARETTDLKLCGHVIQMFADISPAIVQKRWAFKPLLHYLQEKDIKYKWISSFRLSFPCCGKLYYFSTFQGRETIMKQLGIISTLPIYPTQDNTQKCSPFTNLAYKQVACQIPGGSPHLRTGLLMRGLS